MTMGTGIFTPKHTLRNLLIGCYICVEKELSNLDRRCPCPGDMNSAPLVWKDYGPEPFVINIEQATKENDAFRTVLWTGNHFQLTLMSINVGEDIGLENHPNLDQFLRIEQGRGLVKMGCSKDNLNFQRRVSNNYAIIVPAGTWHNLINTGNVPLKLYSIYAPPQHPKGTIHRTKADAIEAEHDH